MERRAAVETGSNGVLSHADLPVVVHVSSSDRYDEIPPDACKLPLWVYTAITLEPGRQQVAEQHQVDGMRTRVLGRRFAGIVP